MPERSSNYLIFWVDTNNIHSPSCFHIFTSIAHVVQIVTITLIQVMETLHIPQFVPLTILRQYKNI